MELRNNWRERIAPGVKPKGQGDWSLIEFSIGKKLVRTSAHSVHTNTGQVPWVALNSAGEKEHAEIFSASATSWLDLHTYMLHNLQFLELFF